MGHRKRRHYTQAEKSEMWDRWQKGESMNEIGRYFGIQGHPSIQKIFSETGGIRPEVDIHRSRVSLSATRNVRTMRRRSGVGFMSCYASAIESRSRLVEWNANVITVGKIKPLR